MVLSKVEYEFFDFEEPTSTARELVRQLRLQFSDAPTLFVSWTSEHQHGPDDQPYSVAYGETSYFSDDAAHVIDASAAPLWSRHVGRPVELAYRRTPAPEFEYQILTLRSEAGDAYIYSLGIDKISLSSESPV